MYNLLISLAVAAAFFLLGWLVAGGVIAGIIPATIGFIAAYFLLGRRTLRQLQALMEEGQAIAAESQGAPPTSRQQAMRQQQVLVDKLKAHMQKGFALQAWQFGVAPQIHSQLGSLEYMQGHYDQAREHLDAANTWALRMQTWHPMTMLALIDFRKGDKDAALAQLEKLKRTGGKDPLFWGVYAYVAKKSKKTELALQVLSEGLERNKSSAALKTLADQLRNKRPLTPEIYGQPWLQFFPEEAQRVLAANPELGPGGGGPQNRAQRRAAARGKDISANNNSRFQHPRY